MRCISEKLGVVVIGRNEGHRLKLCIEALLAQGIKVIIYVDSGSTDGSVEYALSKGINVVDLDTTKAFTMGRARNAGLDCLINLNPDITYVQFVDGDCEVAPGWIETGVRFLESHPNVVSVCGVLRERYPEFSIYNRLLNLEWQGPSGQIKACGGIAIFRVKNIDKLNGFNPGMIAGEEPELCVRLRRQGGLVWRIDQVMALHDANMGTFSQWYKRTVRCGHAYAEGFAMHGGPPEFHNFKAVASSMLYGFILPCVLVLLLIQVSLADAQIFTLVAWLWAGLLVLAWLKVCLSSFRFRRKLGNSSQDSILYAVFVLLAKFPEVQGILVYFKNRIFGRVSALIEYRQGETS